MAQYYGILDASAVPPLTLATLTAGLPEDSRTMRAFSGRRASADELLLAAAVDRLSLLVWFKTKDGIKGRRRPASLGERMTRADKREEAYSVPVDELEETIRRIRES